MHCSKQGIPSREIGVLALMRRDARSWSINGTLVAGEVISRVQSSFLVHWCVGIVSYAQVHVQVCGLLEGTLPLLAMATLGRNLRGY